MKKILNNKLLMFWAVLEVLAKFKEIWSSIAGFVAIEGEFRKAAETVRKTSNKAGTKTREITKDKNESLKGFAELLFKVTSLLSVYATNTHNAALKSSVDYTEGEIKELTPVELLALAEEILEIVAIHKTGLTPLGLQESDITSLSGYVEGLESVASSTRTTITARKTAGGLLRPQVSAANFILKEKLDKLMEQFRASHPEFYDEYWNAREKVDYGVRHESEEAPENTATV